MESENIIPSTEQLDAVQQWAALHGRKWKAALREAWMCGDYQGFENSHLLQQVRNTFGPSWLNKFVLAPGGGFSTFGTAAAGIAAQELIDGKPENGFVTIKPDDGGPAFWITEAQFLALNRKFLQDADGSPNFFAFRQRARASHDCIMIFWCRMWLGIEVDGYTHS
jgi:hypothetical protein